MDKRIIFSISHEWRLMSTYSILVIYDNLFWWKTIRNPILVKMHHHISYSSSFKLILAIWSQEDDLITLSQWWSVCPHVKGSNWFSFNIFFPDHCHLLTLNLLYTGWNIYEFWLQNTFTTASIWINKGKRRFVRSLVCCGSGHRPISPPTSNSSYP